MANSIEDLEMLPDVDILKDEGITLESISDDMVTDYQDKWGEIEGKNITLHPGHPKRLELNVVAGQIYQVYEYASYLFNQNLIKYMEDDVLWNWGANIGFAEKNIAAAHCTMEFTVNESLGFDVIIPKGVRATAGDDVFFATDYEVRISAGEQYVRVSSTCTTDGTIGNEYASGQINILADPVENVFSAKNVDVSSGGKDEYSGDTLREKIYLFPSTISTAGPIDAYAYFAKGFSTEIASVEIVVDPDTAVVDIYIMLSGGMVPSEEYCSKVEQYLESLGCFPDTDRIVVHPPEVINYTLDVTYYIAESNRDTESIFRGYIESAINTYADEQSENLGKDINPNVLVEYIRAAGGKRIEIQSFGYQKIKKNQVAICSTRSIQYGGLEED